MSLEEMDPKAQRIKSLLSSYYGGDEEDEQTGESTKALSQTTANIQHMDEGSSTTSAAVHTPVYSSIDTPAFNCDNYVSTLLKTARIDTLIKTHEDLSK